jgi:hypothetical protein
LGAVHQGRHGDREEAGEKAATQKWGMILTNYLELVDYAQMLQPAMLQSVDRNRLHVIFKAMLKAQVVFPKSLNFLFVQKELEHVAPSAEKRRSNVDHSWVKWYIEVISPWPTPAKPKKPFDLLRPRLCDIDAAPNILLGRMDKRLVEQVVLPARMPTPQSGQNMSTTTRGTTAGRGC